MVLAYFATRDLIPLYSVYALLFRDHAMSPAAISSLFVIWSVTSFVLEVPSGAWADTINRRTLLALSGVVYAVAFSTWMLWPSYPGFALGFALWGLSSAMMSGTFEALLYDELTAVRAEPRYAQIRGWTQTAAMGANLAATALAAPLLARGGYQLVGWASVGIALVHAVLALLLPRADRLAGATREADDRIGGLAKQYGEMLRAGVLEASRVVVVRRVVIVSSAMIGFTAYDEYFPLVVRSHEFATTTVPWFIALFVAGQAVGTALAGRTARWSPRGIALLYGAGAALLAAGSVGGQVPGLVILAIGYGMLNNAFVVGEARLQQLITGPARATVTSVAGLTSELFALVVFAAVAVGSYWWSVATVVALLGFPAMATAVFAWRWLPQPVAAVRQ